MSCDECARLLARAERAEADLAKLHALMRLVASDEGSLASLARVAERARIVAWLRSDGAQVHVVGVNGLDGLRNVADAIERGEG